MAYTLDGYDGLGKRYGFNPFRKGKKGRRGRLYTAGLIAAGGAAYFGGKAMGLWGGTQPPGKAISIPKPKAPIQGPPPPPVEKVGWGPKIGGAMQNIMSVLPGLRPQYQPTYVSPPPAEKTFLGMGPTAMTVAGISTIVLIAAIAAKKKGVRSPKVFA